MVYVACYYLVNHSAFILQAKYGVILLDQRLSLSREVICLSPSLPLTKSLTSQLYATTTLPFQVFNFQVALSCTQEIRDPESLSALCILHALSETVSFEGLHYSFFVLARTLPYYYWLVDTRISLLLRI